MTRPWIEFRHLIETANTDRLLSVLSELDSSERAELLVRLEQYEPARPKPEPVVLPPLEPEPEPELPAGGHVFISLVSVGGVPEEPPRDAAELRAYIARQRLRQREQSREGERRRLEWQASAAANELFQRRLVAHSLAVLCCAATAADVVTRVLGTWDAGRLYPPALVEPLLHARGAEFCGGLARALVRKVRLRAGANSWPFVEALLRATAIDPPATDVVAALWVRSRRPDPASLAEDPWSARLLPLLFDADRVAVALADQGTDDWPRALAGLAAARGTDRAVVLAGCLRRLRTGGRPSRLRPFLTAVELMEPDVTELAGHRQELVGLVTAPLLAVAEYALVSLRRLDRHETIGTGTLSEITRGVLSRPEKKLFRAHLGWLRELARDTPGRVDAVLPALVVGLHHPASDLANRTLNLIAERLPALPGRDHELLRTELPLLDGTVGERLACLLGTVHDRPAPPALPVAEPPPALPEPLDLGALAGELASFFVTWSTDPVRHELMLDGLVRAGRGDRAAATRVLRPLIPVWPGPWTSVLCALTGVREQRPTVGYAVASTDPYPLDAFIQRRVTELASALAGSPPPALLATPGTIAGQVDPARVLRLLGLAERDGWQPGQADLTQALLRLPRDIDPAVLTAARTLRSSAGRRFSEWLDDADRVEPRTWVQDSTARYCRRLAMVDVGGLPADLADRRTAERRAGGTYHRAWLSLWPMVAPGHREVIAAHAQPFLARLTEEGGSVSTDCLAGLALADGPSGPAMSLTVAYVLAAKRESARLAAADALIALATRPDWDSTTVGAEIGGLAGSGRVVLRRTVAPLAEVLRAGGHRAVWEVASSALGPLLAGPPRPGLADLIEVADAAARAGGHRDNRTDGHTGVPSGLDALAAAPGRSQLTTAARRLSATLNA